MLIVDRLMQLHMATATGDWGSLPAQLASPTGSDSVTQRLNFVSLATTRHVFRTPLCRVPVSRYAHAHPLRIEETSAAVEIHPRRLATEAAHPQQACEHVRCGLYTLPRARGWTYHASAVAHHNHVRARHRLQGMTMLKIPISSSPSWHPCILIRVRTYC